ncbi:hypothetical protein K9U39_07630 [Rhodoblastus acidophilus]|uniref:Uncharacterized protein n=1 Tax=Candidatus Rhodoblastus alkanivorans TaxID=2954117 RepID=A0ABS9Z750_9HYPH|nr:hypothetical protein [Candidatus Rhodoblastus alkanivorans]MCI4678704.1 hypothetical protein [Candidatus Rhodoblastus alkanivorans]MCI4683500.1 hypothetical protein [Candidatus Rhodoblastus alkanivorans]MDI4640815.1 hypothetical protein [Rhodoblastus acidophilus]
MTLFSFEVVRAGRPPLLVRTRDLDDLAAAWREVEIVALMMRNYPGASIRVKNAEGGIVILAGLATALATAERCRFPAGGPQQNRRAMTMSAWRRPALGERAPQREN